MLIIFNINEKTKTLFDLVQFVDYHTGWRIFLETSLKTSNW